MSEVAQDPTVFDETKFVTEAGAQGDFTAEERADIVRIRAHYPQLAAWGDLAIFNAWRDYSQSAYMLSWLESIAQDEDIRCEFLDYLWWNQTRGEFPWGADRAQLKSMRLFWHRESR